MPFSPLQHTLHSWSTPFAKTWINLRTGVSSYYGTPFSPTPSRYDPMATPATLLVSKRENTGKENVLLFGEPKKRAKKLPLTVGDKSRLFHGFLKHGLQWSYSEALFHTSKGTSDVKFGNLSLSINDPRLQKRDTSRESMTATLQHFFNGHTEYPPSRALESWYKHPQSV